MKASANPGDAEDTVIYLRLYWLSFRTAHILLSSSKNLNDSNVYDVGLLTHGKSYITVGTNSPNDSVNATIFGQLIFSTDMIALTIRISKTGKIEIGITGQSSFLSYIDSHISLIKYIRFRFVFFPL